MVENFPNLKKEMSIAYRKHRGPQTPQTRETQTDPHQDIIKTAKVKDKERILKAAREKQRISYKGTPLRLSADFSAETL